MLRVERKDACSDVHGNAELILVNVFMSGLLGLRFIAMMRRFKSSSDADLHLLVLRFKVDPCRVAVGI